MNSITPTMSLYLMVAAVAIYLVVKAVQWWRSRPAKPPKATTVSSAKSSVVSKDADGAKANDPAPARPLMSISPSKSKDTAEEPGQPGIEFDGVEEEFPYAGTDDYIFGGLTPVLAAALPETREQRESLTKSLHNAGYYSPHAWHNHAAIRYLGLMLAILFFGTLLLLAPERLETTCIVGLIVGPILGWALPTLVVRNQATERLQQIERGIPDMLDLLNMCVSQGMTVPAALARVGRDIAPVYPALAKELQIVTDQARVGSLQQALTNFSRRVDVPEVHSFTSLLVQTERMGTSVSEALTEYSDSMRATFRQRADEKANAAAFKLLFPTVFCLMPAVFMFLSGPAVIELNRFFQEGGAEVLDSSTQVRRLTTER